MYTLQCFFFQVEGNMTTIFEMNEETYYLILSTGTTIQFWDNNTLQFRLKYHNISISNQPIYLAELGHKPSKDFCLSIM